MMLDLVRLGQRLDLDLDPGPESNTGQGSATLGVTPSEAQRVRTAFKRYGAVPGPDEELSIVIERGSALRFVLRRHRQLRDQWFLNLDGNPLSFRTGQNVYGYPNAVSLILWAYAEVFAALADRGCALPPSIRGRALVGLQVHINHLEFAAATVPLRDKQGLLNAWKYMYGRSWHWDPERGPRSLDRMLGLRVINPEYDNSFCLAFMSGTNREMQFQAYDKYAEYKARRNIEVPDMENRLRLELGLMPRWFGARSIRNLWDMRAYVETNYSGWTDFITKIMWDALDRAYLTKMFEFDAGAALRALVKGQDLPPPVQGLDRRILLMMLEARLEYRVPEHQVLRKLMRKSDYLRKMARGDFDVDPSILGLDLELGRIDDEDALRKSQGHL